MRLKPGDTAPQFEAEDVRGGRVNLADHARHDVFLCFYRYAGCPFCNLNLREVIQFYRRIARPDFTVIALFQSPRESVLKYPAQLNPPFPLIADPRRTVYDLYGIGSSYVGGAKSVTKAGRWLSAHVQGFPQREVDGDFFLMPGQFIVSPPSVISYAHYWTSFGDVTPFDELERYLESGTAET